MSMSQNKTRTRRHRARVTVPPIPDYSGSGYQISWGAAQPASRHRHDDYSPFKLGVALGMCIGAGCVGIAWLAFGGVLA